MEADVEHAGWISAAVKALSAALAAAFGWVWHTSHRQALAEERVRALSNRTKRIEAGVGRILNHLTGTQLHDIEVDEE